MLRSLSGSVGGVLLFGLAVGPAFAAGPGEVGYRQGALGVSAIMASDFKTAETQLNQMNGVTPGDPLRLINLGNVYAATGRMYDAEGMYRAALDRDAVEVTTVDGRQTDTHAVARLALVRMHAVMASR